MALSGFRGIMMEAREFKVRDLRRKEKFFMDDEYVEGWSRYLGSTTFAVYGSLCRHADKRQSTFPSQSTIAAEHGLGERTVREKLKLLQKYNLIQIERIRLRDGTWLNNTYYLLDRSEWIRPSADIADGSATGRKLQNHRQNLPTKDTHSKETQYKKEKSVIVLENTYQTLESLGEDEFEQVSERYSVPIAFVRSRSGHFNRSYPSNLS